MNTKYIKQKEKSFRQIISSPYTKLISAVFAAVVFYFGIKTDWDIQKESEKKSKSVICYAFTISPVSSPFSTLEKSGRWIVSVMIMNQGPATANSLVFHLYLMKSNYLNHSVPIMTSKPATADVNILQRNPPEYFQIVLKNFSPSDGAFFEIPFEASNENIQKLYFEWKKSMFSNDLLKKFINSFELTGENIISENMGMVDAKTMKENLDEIAK
ncbi:MAG: hypothetical protein HY960_04580 [Ignavibacteriae bacterium]|nr:hypothetical protein [Ignavibacteriota bacterium]